MRNFYFYRFQEGPEFSPETWAEIQVRGNTIRETEVFAKAALNDPWVRLRVKASEEFVIGELSLAKIEGRPSAWKPSSKPDIQSELEKIRSETNYPKARLGLLIFCCAIVIFVLLTNTVVLSMAGIRGVPRGFTFLAVLGLLFQLASPFLVYGLGRALLDSADLAFKNHQLLSKYEGDGD